MRNFLATFNCVLTIVCLCAVSLAYAASGKLVFQSDFGLKDGAVSEVKGVMYSVGPTLLVSDLTHDIPAFNIWEAGYRLYQTAPYWPAGTVFVSVVDPGVGTKRRSIVAETRNGQYFVTPDNGTLTLIADSLGIREVRVIDETVNRLKHSDTSHTFHGRDVYGYTAARLASGVISFAEVGPVLHAPIVRLDYEKSAISHDRLKGSIVILDTQYGNLWTNINQKLIDEFGLKTGHKYKVAVYQDNKLRYQGLLPYVKTFGAVRKGEGLIYVNSLLNLAVALNQDDFSKRYGVGSGTGWRIVISAA